MIKNIIFTFLISTASAFGTTVNLAGTAVVVDKRSTSSSLSFDNLITSELFGMSEAVDKKIDSLNLSYGKRYTCDVKGRDFFITPENRIYKVYSIDGCKEVDESTFLKNIKEQLTGR